MATKSVGVNTGIIPEVAIAKFRLLESDLFVMREKMRYFFSEEERIKGEIRELGKRIIEMEKGKEAKERELKLKGLI